MWPGFERVQSRNPKSKIYRWRLARSSDIALFWRVVVLGPEANGRSIVSQEGDADLRGLFPTIIFTKKEMVQKALHVIIGVRLVNVVPLMGCVYTKPN